MLTRGCSLVLALTALSRLDAQGCGVERWKVKTAVDADVASVNVTPKASSVAALRRVPKPTRPLPNNARIAPTELEVYRVRAVVSEVLKEDDDDWHLVLHDPTNPRLTMIAEIPDPACARGSRFRAQYAAARQALQGVQPNTIVELDGVGFFDFLHGQTGVAPNGIELHPVLRARVIGASTGKAPAAATARGATKVWLSPSGTYHCPGSRYYGTTQGGRYVSETAAKAAGGHPASGKACSA